MVWYYSDPFLHCIKCTIAGWIGLTNDYQWLLAVTIIVVCVCVVVVVVVVVGGGGGAG